MMKMLTTFSAMTMAGMILLSLLPDGGLKRTAGMAIGLLTLLCWAEGVSHLLGLELTADLPASILSPTSISLTQAQEAAANLLTTSGEELP